MEEHNDIEAAFSPTKRRRYDEEDGWADNVDFFTEDVPSADDFGDLKEDLLLPGMGFLNNLDLFHTTFQPNEGHGSLEPPLG